LKVILLSGKARHGKDSAAIYLQSKLPKSTTMLFAKYIKQYAKDYFGWDGREETKPRELLQQMGTELIREKLRKPNFHVSRTCEDIEILSKYFDYFIVSDCRFFNEIFYTKAMFPLDTITIRVNRTNYVSELTTEQQNHRSETELDNFSDFNYVIDASNLDELYFQIDQILLNIKGDDNESIC
jgi:hypothetical protein